MNKKFVQDFLTPKIIFEDDDVLVVEKPAGLVVYDHKGKERSLIDLYTDKISPTLQKKFPDRLGLVHRLDKDTSGLIIIAKNENALIKLQNQFHDREIGKEYIAVVHGKLGGKTKIILPIGRTRIGKMGISSHKIKEAETIAEPITNNNDLTMLKVSPKTGRTHQIRVHLKSIGYPVVGDKLYGLIKTDKKLGISRMYLHASTIEFKHPGNGKAMRFTSETPKEFDLLLK